MQIYLLEFEDKLCLQGGMCNSMTELIINYGCDAHTFM